MNYRKKVEIKYEIYKLINRVKLFSKIGEAKELIKAGKVRNLRRFVDDIYKLSEEVIDRNILRKLKILLLPRIN